MSDRRLGRKKPDSAVDFNGSRIVKDSSGRLHVFPRLDVHYDAALDLAPPPPSVDWSRKALTSIHNILDNDTLGCCVIASRYHNLGVLSGNETGQTLVPTDVEVRGTYIDACGPGDQGCDMSAVCTYRQQTGFPVQGTVYRTAGSTSVDHTNVNLVKVAIEVFGGLDVGLHLPNTWYQSANFADWAPVPGDQIVGGHEVQAFGYDSKGVWIATWGGKRRILWSAFTDPTWVDELYVELSPVWWSNKQLAPNGLNVATLQSAFSEIAAGRVP